MAAKIEIFTDDSCTELLGSFGHVDIETPFEFYIKNTGTTRLIDIALESTVPDVEVITHVTTLDPGEIGTGAIYWEGEEGPRDGEIKTKAMSVG